MEEVVCGDVLSCELVVVLNPTALVVCALSDVVDVVTSRIKEFEDVLVVAASTVPSVVVV